LSPVILHNRLQCEGELEWIDVSADSRRNGIATILLRKLAAWFVEHDAFKICVNCAPDNKVAENFYIKNGAVRLSEYWLIWNDIRMILNLKP
jgi:GNAT superfamily N-acetyltransferase